MAMTAPADRRDLEMTALEELRRRASTQDRHASRGDAKGSNVTVP